MHSRAPKVTVVIPAFNVASYVADCLASVRAQTLPDWECIVVDDGSTDGTAERVRGIADPRIRLHSQRNQGVSAARNAGLAQARGAYVLFLDGDDRLHPQALSRLASRLDPHPESVAAYGTVWVIFEDGSPYPQKPLRVRRIPPSGDVLGALLRWELFLQIGSVMIRTTAARRLGGFKEELRLSEDWEFCCRLAALGHFRFVGAEPEVSHVRMRTRSASRSLSPDWENHLPTLRAVIESRVLASRFPEGDWRRLKRQVLAAHLWEAGRMNFIARRYGEARRLMLRSFSQGITAKRIALFLIAQVSQLVGVSLVPRLRFLDEDARH
jgi:glycosyltransferase involved in cell wall biosynthesis